VGLGEGLPPPRLDAGTLPQRLVRRRRGGAPRTTIPRPTSSAARKWVKTIYDHAIKSPQWERLAILWTYDRGAGAFAGSRAAAPNEACVARPPTTRRTHLISSSGWRVPLRGRLAVGQAQTWVSHVVQEHTAITRFHRDECSACPALTSRDAELDPPCSILFDFSSCTPPMLKAAGTRPAVGHGRLQVAAARAATARPLGGGSSPWQTPALEHAVLHALRPSSRRRQTRGGTRGKPAPSTVWRLVTHFTQSLSNSWYGLDARGR